MSVFIIAEAGVNHNGDINLAKKLIDIAAKSGVDAVKFQTYKTENLTTKFASLASYQKKVLKTSDNQFSLLKKLELSYEDFYILKSYSETKGVKFLSSPFDLESLRFLIDLQLDIIKIPSGEIVNYLLLKELSKYNKKVILSTGMADLGEIEDALDVLLSGRISRDNIILLHCNSQYPTPFEDVNLRAMLTLKEAFKIEVGYSDHTPGIEVPIAAAALGAKVVEKHFTLDKTLEGPDHKASLSPEELKDMVKAIRNIEKALGNGIKKPSSSESLNKEIIRKSIVAKKDIKKGELFSSENLALKRPGSGLSPMRWNELIGKKALRDFLKDELIF